MADACKLTETTKPTEPSILCERAVSAYLGGIGVSVVRSLWVLGLIEGSGVRVHGSEFRVQGSGFRVQGLEFKVQG